MWVYITCEYTTTPACKYVNDVIISRQLLCVHAYIDELLCSGRTGGFAYDNQYYLSVEPVGLPFKDDPLYISISAEPVGLPSNMITRW